MKARNVLATPTTGLAYYCTAHSNKGESTKFTFVILYALYKNIIVKKEVLSLKLFIDF